MTEVVERFYRRVLDDPELSGIFGDVDMDRLKSHQVALFSKVLGGPDHYRGRSLEAAHRDLGITDAQYDKVGGHLIAVLDELGVGEPALTTISTTLGAVRPDIVEQTDELTAPAPPRFPPPPGLVARPTRRSVGRPPFPWMPPASRTAGTPSPPTAIRCPVLLLRAVPRPSRDPRPVPLQHGRPA